MSMQSTTAPVADWFKELPLSNPQCNNDSCIAYKDAHAASQAAVPYILQFKYGHWTMWIFAIFIFCYSVYFYSHVLFRKGGVQQRPNPLDKITAALRWVSYRRIKGTVADKMGLPSLGVCLVVLSGWIATTIMAFAVHPYYRERRGYSSPPLGVRTGLIAFALIPLTFATAGKVIRDVKSPKYQHELMEQGKHHHSSHRPRTRKAKRIPSPHRLHHALCLRHTYGSLSRSTVP